MMYGIPKMNATLTNAISIMLRRKVSATEIPRQL